MSISPSQASRFLVRTNKQRHTHVFGQVQNPVHTADPTVADQTASHPHYGAVPSQDPFTYYKAFLNTESPSNVRSNVMDQHDDGDTRGEFRSEGQPTQGHGEQQQNRPRAVPCNLAVRFANRSNGAPLATIIEQGSVSTLNSHGSLLSVGRFPSIRTVENVSPGGALHRSSRSLDENGLKRIQEEEHQEHIGRFDTLSDKDATRRRDGKPESCRDRATTPCSVISKDTNIPQLPEADLDLETKGLRGFLRSVLTNVRGSTSSRSRLSSSRNFPTTATSKQRPAVSPPGRLVHRKVQQNNSRGRLHPVPASTTRLQSTSSSPCYLLEPEVTDRSSPSMKTQTLAGMRGSISYVSSSTFELDAGLPSAPQLPPLSDLSCLRNGKEPSSSVCPVLSEPRDAAQDHVRHAATTFLSRSRDELAARYTPDGAVVHCNGDGSLRDYVRNSSRNASFCSTMSTSYSGTVLGVDLDLQHDFPHSARRSLTPVWFSPKETAVEVQEQPKREMHLETAKPLRPRSITSSALTSLLPIAAAEGIVQQNLTTPQLSFYSPSGNLIQAQDSSSTVTPASSSRSRSDSYFSGKPVTTTSYYNGTILPTAHSALSAAVNLPLARPAPVPLATSQSTAPLPEHLRHHHNYQQVERSQIESMSDSEPTFIFASGSKVRGCGGVVRPTSLDPHSGVAQSSQKHSRIGYSMACLHVGEANRSRFNNLLPSRSAHNPSCYSKVCGAAAGNFRKKGNTLQKRQRPPHIGTVPEHGDVGPVAGHALRICFCQPYDGTSKQTSKTGCGGAATHRCECQNEACEREPQTGTPNARVVISQDGKARDKSRPKGRVRSDSAVSIGIRVGSVGD